MTARVFKYGGELLWERFRILVKWAKMSELRITGDGGAAVTSLVGMNLGRSFLAEWQVVINVGPAMVAIGKLREGSRDWLLKVRPEKRVSLVDLEESWMGVKKP